MTRQILVALMLAVATGVPTNQPKPRLVHSSFSQIAAESLISQSTVQHRMMHLTSATPSVGKDGVHNRPMLVLLIGFAAVIAAGSSALLVFASFSHLPIPQRSLMAAAAVTCGSALMEALVGYPRRSTVVGITVSEVGQALAIGATGWMAFSALWVGGYGSVLSPGRRPFLNGGAVAGCAAAAALYGCLRPSSRAQTAVPFGSALFMLHLHWLLNVEDLEDEIRRLTLGPMSLASSFLVLLALGLDVVVQRAAHGERVPAAYTAPRQSHEYLKRVRGTEDLVIVSIAINLLWSFLTLLKWTCFEAPPWGFVAIAIALSAVELGMRAAFAAMPVTARATRGYYIATVAGYYRKLANWLALLCTWRTLWPDADTSARKREKHFFSLIGAFSLWGVTSASAGRMGTSYAAVGMVILVIFKTAVASLFEEPLMMAGVLGLALGTVVIGFLVRFVGDELIDGA